MTVRTMEAILNMEHVRQKVSQLTRELQSQTDVPLWALANEQVIYSLAINENVPWGTKAKILASIIQFAVKIKMTDFLLFIAGFIKIFSMWWRIQRKKNSDCDIHAHKKIFAGFGAAPEKFLYAEYWEQNLGQVHRINWATLEGINRSTCPSLSSLFSALIRNTVGHTATLEKAIPSISSHLATFLTVSAKNVGAYSFFRAYWQKLKVQGIDEVVFLSPDMFALACVDENIHSVFLQHGLLAISILVPNVKHFKVITEDEERYYSKNLKNTKVERYIDVENSDEEKNNLLLFLLPIKLYTAEKNLVEQILALAARCKLKIVFRSPPYMTEQEFISLKKIYSDITFDDLSVKFNESLQKWRPKFVVSWSSTGLATALDFGCLPISLLDPINNKVQPNMIYSMNNRALFWPRDEEIIKSTANQNKLFQTYLVKFRRYEDHSLITN